MQILVQLFSCWCFLSFWLVSCKNETDASKTFKLLKEGRQTIELTSADNVIIFLGPTGSGKSSTVQWIAGDNTNLISNETLPVGSGEYIIEDTNDKIGPSSVSKTLFPELVVDPFTQTVFYDFPGFTDTRNASYDIAASFFMKTVLNHVKNVKLIFVTSYYTVQKGVDRMVFPGLLKNIDDLVKDVDKFKNSIALVVTKVDNDYIKVKGKPVLKSDSIMIQGVAHYLIDLIRDYENELERSDISDKRRSFCKKAIKIIGIFLTKENEEYTRIKLFRRPDEPGPLSSTNPSLMEEKVLLKKMLLGNLRFTNTRDDDFGLTISDNSKLGINSLASAINEIVTASIRQMAADAKEHLASFVEPVRAKMNGNNLEALSLAEAAKFASEAENKRRTILDAVNYFTSLKAMADLAGMKNKYLTQLEVHEPSSIKESLEYFEFFQRFNEDLLPISNLVWAKSFESVSTYLTEAMKFVSDKASSTADEINSQITSAVDSIFDDIKANFMIDMKRIAETIDSMTENANAVKVNRSDAKVFTKKLHIGSISLTKLAKKVKVLPEPQKLSDEISNTLSSIGFEIPNELMSIIRRKSYHFKVLETVSNKRFKFPSLRWSTSIQTVLTLIESPNILTNAMRTEQAILAIADNTMKSLTNEAQIIVSELPSKLEADKVDLELKRWRSLFALVRDNFGAETLLKELTLDIASSLSKLNVDGTSIRGDLRLLDKQERYLGFLKSLKRDDSDVTASPVWISHINGLVQKVDVEINFNEFIMELYKALSKFEVQKDVSRYNVQNLADWGRTGRSQEILIDKRNFRVFMEKVKELNIEAGHKIRDIIPNESQLSILNNVLMFTLKKQVILQCPKTPGSSVTLQANFIKFSDFLDFDGTVKGCGWSNVAALEIYALNSLFIDRDLNAMSKRLKLSIVTARVEVIGIRKIVLDGRDAKSLPRAANGSSPGSHGLDGSPGLAGESAGSVFVAANTFVSSVNLTISANGGNGGPGQSGGNGANGLHGKDPPDGSCYQGEYAAAGFEVSEIESNFFLRTHFFNVTGTNGGIGGNAVSCGVGGIGGLSGKITVVGLSEELEVRRFALDGKNGGKGLSGAFGYGGQHGGRRELKCGKGLRIGGVELPKDILSTAAGYAQDAFSLSMLSKISTSLTNRGAAANGKPRYDCNSQIPESSMPAAIFANPGSYLRNFQKFVIENLHQRFGQLSVRAITQIVASPGAKEFHDTLELIEEMKMLESFSRETNLKLVPFYESFLANIEEYAFNPKSDEKSDEYRKVLNYLYTATLTQISNQKRDLNSDLVINIGGYLDIVSKNIKDLTALNSENKVVSIVNTLQNNFQEENDKKIEQALNLIKLTIKPELAHINAQFGVHMSALVRETAELQRSALVEKAALVSKKTELQNALIVNTCLKVLNVIGDISSFFGPVGAAVSVGIKATTTVAGALRHGKSLKFPSQQSTELGKKLQGLGNSAVELSASMNSDLDSISDVTSQIKDMEVFLKDLRDFEKRIHENLVPLIEKMGHDLINTANSLKNLSSVSLDVTGWQVQETLKDTSREIQKFTRNFEVHDSVARLIEKIEEVMKILVKVYERIQNYQEQQRLAVYLAQLTSAPVRQIVVSNPKISNSFRELQISIQSNIILSQYNSAVNAFKQWIFPFAEFAMKDLKLPTHLVSNSTDITVLASFAKNQLQNMKTKIQIYKTTITKFDNHIYLAQFDGNSHAMEPFYVWKNADHRDMIAKLLAGETVFVKANVKFAADKEAIKFNFIQLRFKSDDSKLQETIDKNLLNFGVSMTHMGNSNYRYNDQYFSITSPSQSIIYSFEKSANGEVMNGNNVYHKLLSGDIMLSPYSMWELKLTLTNNESFNQLAKFSDKVDLVLEGSGSYVKSKETNFDVESYYEVDDSIKLVAT